MKKQSNMTPSNVNNSTAMDSYDSEGDEISGKSERIII
jgi:hypothetical protein